MKATNFTKQVPQRADLGAHRKPIEPRNKGQEPESSNFKPQTSKSESSSAKSAPEDRGTPPPLPPSKPGKLAAAIVAFLVLLGLSGMAQTTNAPQVVPYAGTQATTNSPQVTGNGTVVQQVVQVIVSNGVVIWPTSFAFTLAVTNNTNFQGTFTGLDSGLTNSRGQRIIYSGGAGDGSSFSNVPFASLVYPAVNTNQIQLSGLTWSTNNGTGINIAYGNGAWKWSGTAYTNGNNGIFYVTEVSGAQYYWLWTNATYDDVSTPHGVAVLSGLNGGTDPDPLFPADGTPSTTIIDGDGNGLIAGAGWYPTNGLADLATTPVLPWAPLAKNKFSTNPPSSLNVINTTDLDTGTSNSFGSGLAVPVQFSPLTQADSKGALSVLLFGDSTAAYPESPIQQFGGMMISRYGYGGWGMFSGGVIANATGSYRTAVQYTGGVTEQDWSQNANNIIIMHAWIVPTGGAITWTNNGYANTASADGAFPGATKAVVWYYQTNSAASFKIQINTNGTGFSDTILVNANGTLGALTNVVVNLGSGLNTNHYLMKVVGVSGTVWVAGAGMWNEYQGARLFSFCQGGWMPWSLYHTANPYQYDTNSADAPRTNMFAPMAPDLVVSSFVNGIGTDGMTNASQHGAMTNLVCLYMGLSALFNRFNTNELSLWVTEPENANFASYGYWQWQAESFLTIFATNNTGHDYVFYTPEYATGERWQNRLQYNGGTSPSPHWSLNGGRFVAHELMRRLHSFQFSPTIGRDISGNPITALMGASFVATRRPPTAAELGTNGWRVWASSTNAIWIFQSPDGSTLNSKIIANF